jgi:hypothetical protein
VLYRASGIVLKRLTENKNKQLDLFGHSAVVETFSKIYEAIDAMSNKYGKHTIFLGTSLKAMTMPTHSGNRGDAALRTTDLFKGETRRKRLAIPMLGDVR